MKNILGRDVPETHFGRKLTPFQGAWAHPNTGRKAAPFQKTSVPGVSKVVHSIKEAIQKAELADGMTISFHHCFRDGDKVVNLVLDTVASMGIKDLRLFATALFPVHAPLVEHIRNGVITRVEGSMNGPIGDFVSQGGKLKAPALLRSHGGRWRAVEAGDVTIDVAFIAAPQADDMGNATGVWGKHPCGTISYATVDSRYARKTIVITDDLAPYPVSPFEIQQGNVDIVCVIDEVGDPNSIASGTLEITKSPARLRIAQLAMLCCKHSPYYVQGFSYQGGAGGISLAATQFMGEQMARDGIVGNFAIGGVTKVLVDFHRAGIIRKLLDAQAFDLAAIQSLQTDPGHLIIDVGQYASFDTAGCTTYKLDAGFLGATEVDLDFNVNVNSHSDGKVLHGIGGHQDVAAGAKMCVITVPSMRGRLPVIMDKVTTVTTPGEVVDVIVTERGIAVNPLRGDLKDRFLHAGLPVRTLEEMKAEAERQTKPAGKPVYDDEVVAMIEWRDGTILDAARRVIGWEP